MDVQCWAAGGQTLVLAADPDVVCEPAPVPLRHGLGVLEASSPNLDRLSILKRTFNWDLACSSRSRQTVLLVEGSGGTHSCLQPWVS